MRVFLSIIFSFFTIFLPAQQVETIAGMLEVVGATDGPAFEASFNNPHGIAVDPDGNVYVADRFGHKIRKYTQDGIVTTLAGSGIKGDDDGVGTAATFNEPWGLCVGNDGNIYVGDTRNNLIRKITPEGVVTTFAGTGAFGTNDGAASIASFGNPTGLDMDEEGNLYVADHLSHVIRKITPAGNVSTVAGVTGSPGFVDGFRTNALFNRPYGLTLDSNGDILVADEWNHRIRRVTPAGLVTTVAGAGTIGHDDGTPEESTFNYPWDMTVDDLGNIYVADGYNQVIRKLVPTGSVPESYEVSTYVGASGDSGGTDGYGDEATFNAATSIHFWEQTGEFFVADAYNNLIRKIIDLNRPSLEVELVNLEDAGLALDQAFFCVGTPLEFDAFPDTLDNYAFFVNGVLMQNGPATIFTVDDLPAGQVQINVRATDGIGQVESNTITVFIQETLIEDILVDGIEADPFEGMINFSALLNDDQGISYAWDFGEPNAVSDLAAPSYQYLQGGVYTVQLIAENTVGCVDTLQREQLIEYELPAIIYVPNAFSPNGDGKNDVLYVRGEGIDEVEFSVFNQWGQLVFQTFDKNEGWDGNFKNKPASNCSYTYLVKAKMNSGDTEVRSGHVSIVR